MKKVYEASSPGCYRVSRGVIDLFSSRTISAFTRLLTLLCFAVLGHTAVFAQGGCPGGACTITCPADVSLCLAPDNYGHSAITPDWVASFTSSPNPDCSITRVWKDAMGMVPMTDPIWVDCDDVDDHVDLWVSREKPLWVECRSSLVKVRVHIKDCEPPAIACPPMGMYVCKEDIPTPGTNYFGYRLITAAQFQNLGGTVSDACGIWGILYKDQVISTDPVCKTNRVINRTFWAYDVNGNEKICTQEIVVSDNVPPTFTENPADLTLDCDCGLTGGGGGDDDDDDDDDDKPDPCLSAINTWLSVNTNPGNQSGQDAVVTDNCPGNEVKITAVPGTSELIMAQMPPACDPNPREVIVVFTATDGCGNQATRSAKVRMVDNEEPTVPPIANSFYTCASQVPPAPNFGVVINARDNCTPTNKLTIELRSDNITNQECDDKFTQVRVYRITDCDGNYIERSHTIYVNDNVKPYWNPAPQPLFLMNVCGLNNLETEIQGWMNQNGYGTAKDDCGNPTVTVNKAATDVASYLLRFCETPGQSRSTTVTFTARDKCGNTTSATVSVRLMDTQPPTGQAPAEATYDCPDDVPQMLANQVIFLNDNCTEGNTVQVAIERNPTPYAGCRGNPAILIRQWRLTDCSGNTSIVTQMIRVQDETAPTWTNRPDDFDLSCTDGGLNTKLNDWLTNIGGSSAALDACDGSNVKYSYDPPSVNAILNGLGACAPKAGSKVVTFYAEDQCGNRVSATATVTIRDNTPPTASSVSTQVACEGQIPAPNPAVITDEADVCSPNPPTVEHMPGATTNNGGKGCVGDPLVITRWYKLTDCTGNTASVSHRITVMDMTGPQALCQALTRSLGPNGTVTVQAGDFNNGSFDNCAIKKIEIRRGSSGPWYSELTFDCSDIPDLADCGGFADNSQIITIQMRVLDNCDQQDICTTTITVVDNTPPVIACPADMTFYTSDKPGYDCRVNANWTHPVPTDNCKIKCLTMEVQKMINGQFVTVNPANDFPTPNFEVDVLAQAGQPVSYMFAKGPYCTDNQYKIIYRTRDEHGNNKPGVMCMFKITLKDNEAPRWNDCPVAPIVAQTVTGDCYQMKCYKRPTAYDNCEYPGGPCPAPTVVVTVSDPTVMINQVGDEDCALFPVGRTVVTYTATDAEGNVSTCTVEVLISDPQPPMAMCVAPFTINLEPDGDTQITFATIDAGSTDNCGICVKEIKRAGGNYGGTVDFTCADLNKSIVITLRVKDCAQPTPNEHTCTTSVFVEDMQSPGIAYCPADITVGTDANKCTAVATYTQPLFNDGCNSPKQGTLTQGLASGSVFPIGVTHVQYCYTSPSGYTVCCDFNVTVEDDENPNIVCPANVTNLTCQQTLPAPLALGAFTGGTLTDNCGVTALDYSDYNDGFTACDNDPVHTVVRTYRAFDAAGNSSTCSQSFTYIEDSVAPIFSVNGTPVAMTANEIPGATGKCAGDVPAPPTVTADDGTGCGGVVIDAEVVLLNLNNSGEPECTNKFRMIRSWVASDVCGNTRMITQLITINDDVNPALNTKPGNMTLSCIDDVPAAPTIGATDNCGYVTVDFFETEDPGPVSCPNSVVIRRTWTATDACGNTDQHTQTITVSDNTNPVLSANPANETYQCAAQVPAVPTVTASDNCDVVNLDFSEITDPGICVNSFVLIRTWRATDLCGNTAVWTQTVTVNDTQNPTFTNVPPNANVSCAALVPAVVHPTANDNCTLVNVDFAEIEVPGDCPNSYTVLRRWVATDLCGNQAVTTQVITVSDTQAPIFAGLPSTPVNVNCAQDVPAAATPTATDNCDGVVTVFYSEELRPGDCANRFSIIRTWTAEDLCSNVTRFVQTITVNDTQAPTWNEPAPANPTVECSQLVPAVPVQTATDNCGVPVFVDFSEVEVPGTCSNQYSVVRTWVAMDDCGNSTKRVQTVTVSDIIAPVLVGLPPATVNVTCAENVPAMPNPAVTATDNCGAPIDIYFSEVEIPGTCANQYQITRTWRAQDDCGNATTFVQTITINDNVAPVLANLPPATVTVECSQQVPAVAAVTVSDNCNKPIDLDFSEVEIPGTCPNQYVITRTWRASDDCGNSTSFVQTITISDTKAPVFAGLPPATVDVVCADDVPAVANVTATDNCGAPIDVELSEVEIPGICVNKYTVTRTWTAEDDCGNITTFVQTINVNDNVAPELFAKPLRRHYDCIEDVEVAPYQFATDNCGVATVEFSETSNPGNCPSWTVIERRWVAYDLCGNSSTWEQIIDVRDTIAPVLSITPVDRTFECFDEVPAAPLGLGASDNCGVAFVDYSESTEGGANGDPNWSCPNNVVITRRWVAFDLCGNTAEHIQTITVHDEIIPAFIVTPVDRTYECLEDVPPAPTEGVIAQDNCEVVFVDFLETTDNDVCQNQVIIKRKWEATDACGNKNTHWQTITVFDDKAPVLANLPAATVNVECSEEVPAKADVTVTDNCGAPIDFDFTEVEVPGTCPNQYQIIRTWSAQDACGNYTSFVQTITISDTEAPVWTSALPGNMTLQCGETVPAAAVLTASDNCNAPVDIELSETFLPGSGPNDGAKIVRTWTAEDDCGNATTHVQTITINDIEAPVLVGTPAATVNVSCSENVPAVAVVTATDNCQGTVDVELVEIEIPGTCPNQYQITRTWTAVDFAGNSTIFVQTITVFDNVAPVFAGLPAATVNVSCSENVPALAVVTATDNCNAPVDVEISEVEVPGTCPNQYSITRTWTAEDDCGNITSFVQTITVFDNVAPVFAGLPAATVNVECSEQVPALAVVTATDNCNAPVDVEISEIEIPGTCPNQYSITRTWTAQDDCGNATVFTQTITVSDTKAPVWTSALPGNMTLQCGETVPAAATLTASDNCNAPVDIELSETYLPGSGPNDGGKIVRTWTAEDDCGNATTHVQTITIEDLIAPVLVGTPAATVTVSCSENVPAVAVVTATDNCLGTVDVELVEVEIPGTCPNQYSITRTWTAVDFAGNSTVFVQTITVNDTEAPVWTSSLPADMSLNCGETVPAAATLTATDNCNAPVDIELSETFLPGSGPNDGSKIVRTWTAEDDCGNATVYVQTITINDTQAPVLVGTPDAAVSVSCSENVPAVATVTATDNCQGTVDVDFNEVEVPGTCPNQYQVVRTWTAVDFAGNSTIFVQTITVNDTQAPVLSGLPADALVTVSCAQDVPAVPVVTASDNCNAPIVVQFSEVEIPGTCANQYSITRTWSAQDDCGNATVFVQTIVINDTEAPTWNQPAPVTPIDVKGADAVPPVPTQTATDNCGAPVIVDFSETIQQGNCLHQFVVTRTWVAQDDCGNSTVRQQVINVNDDVPPTITCPPAQQAQCSPAEIPPYANLTEFIAAGGSASDNNGLNVNSFGMVSEVKNGNVYTRTYRVTDQCGNSATCEQTITVIDTEAPIFLNCPVVTLVFGNDPDKCSAKINWPAPVAVDNCSVPTVVQTAGPTSGSIVSVGTYTVAFTATDAAGNVGTCQFTVMVMDTQNPTFDADIVMPADVTVECDAVPAPFVLTNNDVSDNCTPSAQLVITFTEVRTNGTCAFNYTLTRTWKVTDQAGNMLVHTQIVTVRDTKAPTALCKNVTVTLDKAGNATITGADVNNGSTDNCSTAGNLTFTVTPSAFDCSKVGTNVVTLTVTDQCGNSSTCTAIVTVAQGIGPCAPQYTAATTCLNNATTLDNGQFQDLITVKSLAMQTWTLITNTGLYSTTSPAPPAAPVAIAAGTALTAGTADGIDNDGDGQIDEADEMIYYTLRGRHVEGVGYSIQVRNNLNQTGTISNKGYYPSPYFLNLNDPFCLNTPPFTIQVGEYNNAQGNVINVMVNGVATTTFNAASLGIGFHTVMATFDAGTPTTNLVINGQLVGGTDAQAQADPGCQQKITKVVQITNTPTVVVCNDLVNVSLHNDGGDCVFAIAPDDVLEGSYLCDDDYSVVLTYPFGTHTFSPANRVDYTHIGKVIKYSLVHAISGNVCWGEIKVEDKEPPALTCPGNITIACSDPTEPSFTGNVLVSDCNPVVNTIRTDDFTDFGSCNSPRAQIIRTWLSTDGSGNQASCSQVITIKPFDLADVDFPADITLNCATAPSTDPSLTGVPTINGSPIGTGGLCMASISRTDDRYDICPGSYEIVRTWKVRNMCLPLGQGNPVEHAQVIKIVDTNGPTFACPANVTVSVDPFACCATAALPDVIISEGCSYVTSLTYKVVGTDFATGNLVIYEGSGSLSDFPGNNWWNPDTMGVFGFTQCLPRGEYTVTYTATDGCDNVSKCTFTMFVEDQIPPVSACDEFTQVALGGDGMAFVNASTFDDGSYDVCESVHFKARRMNDNDCQDNDFFYDQVKFCCDDINDTVLVVFRVYDIPVPNGSVALDFGEGHYNDCMVQVFVEDKIKPLCNAPANTTVSCENFDPSLWAYGAATGADNCCLDTITTTTSYTLFDTVCNRGTITRTFRVFDCGGNQSTCTQRIFVNYEQDYWVKFPNDVIVTVCDGTGTYGEPTFANKDCELLGVSFEDEIFTVVPDACFKIERTWTIINWCTYNPNAGCINVPNPNPNAIVNNPANLTGPIVSPAGTPAPWNPTVIAIAPGQTPTNYSTFWDANANCYKYKQIIKVIDTQDPIVENCPTSPVEVCDLTPNNNQLWNESYWYDSKINSHDLCEAPTDLTITATDLCSGASVNVRYLLFLDLDGDGTMETVVSSTNLPGFNTVNFGNANNPNFGGGTPRQFDERPVPSNQKYGFALQTTVNGTKKTAAVRWNTQQNPTSYSVPELPYGTHKIKWIVEDGCGNETVCEYTFIVKDCKAPTVVCLNGLSVNIMPTKMIQMWANDFLQYTEDNCTPSSQIVLGIRRSGTGTGFPLNPDGTPQTSVTFTCDDLGTQLVELWAIDKAGNADYCETYVIVQDNNNNCSGPGAGTVAGLLATEANNGLEEANVELDGSHPALPPSTMFDFSDNTGHYEFSAVPFLGDYTVTPIKDNDPLNGVSTFDLVLINKHILGLEPLNSPYKMIGADANNSRSITTFDIVELRKLILGIYTELPNNTSWRFVDADYNFPNSANPFQEIFPETKQIADMQNNMMGQNFVSQKVGDVNGNAVTSSLTTTEDRTAGTLLFDVQDRQVKAGESFTVNFRAAERVMGYQFTLYFPNLEVTDITAGSDMKLDNFGIFNSDHALTTSFDNEHAVGEFAVTFRSKAAGSLSEMLTVSSRITKAEAYDLNREPQAVALRFNGQNGSTITGLGFELYQNQPNPWMNKTQVGFYLPEAAEATLTIYDETGRTLFTQKGDFSKGYNAIAIERALVNTTGLLYYKVETDTDSAVKKMIQTK